MQLSKKAKLALGLAVLLVIAVIIVLNLNKPRNAGGLPIVEESQTDEIYAPETIGYKTVTPDEQSPIDETSPTIYTSPTTSPVRSITPGSSTSKTAARTPTPLDVNGIRRYTVSVTPHPGAGMLDWTRRTVEVIDVSQSPLKSQTPCKIAGYSNSWENPIEKIACDSINFFSGKLFEQLSALNCAFAASALQANYDERISFEYENGSCKILDRPR